MSNGITRRGLIGVSAGVLATAALNRTGLASTGSSVSRFVRTQDTPTGPFTLPPLPYDFAALEPHIDALTMEIHHDRHHNTYVTNLNKIVVDHPEIGEMIAADLILGLDGVDEAVRAGVRNNAGGHVNHSFFWEIMAAPGSATEPGEVGEAINSAFGGMDAMVEAVNAAGLSRFGSGWSWLVLGGDGKLAVLSTPNQDNPLMDAAGIPILGIDVWEHAYYLKYQNKRADYLTAWWNVVNWTAVNEKYLAAISA